MATCACLWLMIIYNFLYGLARVCAHHKRMQLLSHFDLHGIGFKSMLLTYLAFLFSACSFLFIFFLNLFLSDVGVGVGVGWNCCYVRLRWRCLTGICFTHLVCAFYGCTYGIWIAILNGIDFIDFNSIWIAFLYGLAGVCAHYCNCSRISICMAQRKISPHSPKVVHLNSRTRPQRPLNLGGSLEDWTPTGI